MRKSIPLLMPFAKFSQQKQIIGISMLLALCSCTKDPADNKVDNIRQEFTVVETVSNTPVPGVTVGAYNCSSAGWPPCSGFGNLLGTAITNDSGKVVFNTSSVSLLRFSKDQYWSDQGLVYATSGLLAINSFELTPVATLKVKLTRVNQYPSGYMLNMWVPGGNAGSENSIKQLFTPRDGIIYIKGKGNCTNSIGWSVDETVPKNFTPGIFVNRFDTAELSIEY